MTQRSEQSGKKSFCECDRRHVSDTLPAAYLCGFVLAGVFMFVLGAAFTAVLSEPVACLNAPFGNS